MSALTINVLLLLGGIGALYFGAEWLVRGAARLASYLGIHPIVVGLTIVSLGTSAPELAVCLLAALDGNADLAIGNVMGSNLANIGLILGLTAVIRPLKVAARVVHREVPLMVLITLLFLPLAWDHHLGRVDGILLIVMLVAYVVFVFKSAGMEDAQVIGEYEEFAREAFDVPADTIVRDTGFILAGSAALVLGGTAIVEGGVFIANELGLSQIVIGLTAVAIGTSLPELATSLVASIRGEADIAVGNVVGSNIFNLGAVLGITSTVAPIPIQPTVLSRELPAVIFLSLLVWPVTRSGFRIKRWEGAMLLATYALLGYWLVWPAAVDLL